MPKNKVTNMEIKMASEEAYELIAQQTEPTALEATMTRVQLFKAGHPNWTKGLEYTEVKRILMLYHKADYHHTEDIFFDNFDNYLNDIDNVGTLARYTLQLAKRL